MHNPQTAEHFSRAFGQAPSVVAAAPGRVNLIGEHVDYNAGLVLPFAIAQRTVTAAAATTSGTLRVRSAALASEVAFPVDAREPEAGCWGNYVRGMVFGLRALGVRLTGGALWIGGDLPPGSGMSSSAALCISTGLALSRLAGVDVPLRELALIAQRAEHDFAGTPCGVMDQYASCFGRAGHALLLDCRDLTHADVPFRPDGLTILAIPSGVKHALADGAYERRVRSCQRAVAALAELRGGIRSLRDVDAATLAAARDRLDDETYRRARHVVTELERVQAAAGALRAGDFEQLGTLLWQTQDSLRDDYAVSCREIDDLIELLRAQPAVRGARMVGGGFGGVVLALVAREGTAEVVRRLAADYYEPNALPERPFAVTPSAGAEVLRTADQV